MDYSEKKKKAMTEYYVFGILDELSEMASLIANLRGTISDKTESVEKDFIAMSHSREEATRLFVEFMDKDSERLSTDLCEEIWRLYSRYHWD